ncbi:MAG: elongation factor P [Patescibacteria group bacterium]
MLDINDLKKIGIIVQIDNQPYIVLDSQHARTAQRRAFVRTKLKNLITGVVIDKTFNAGDKIEEAEVEKIEANYLYSDEENIYLMNTISYEQFALAKDLLFGREKYLKEGQEVTVLFFNQKPINIELPKKVELRVIEAPPGIRGDSASNIMKQVTLETGLKINVPLFIKENDIVRINTETGEYVERV